MATKTRRGAVRKRMTAKSVRECLALRWPDSEYLLINEAPDSADRGGRKLDVLAVTLWRSRGLQLDGAEIKVSASDWKRELKDAEKADWWWRHVHRFWIAAPAELATSIAADLPPTWGLLACEEGKPARVVRKAPVHEPEPLPWGAVVGLMRASADAGVNALRRARAAGIEIGERQARAEFERRSPEKKAQEELARLRERLEVFRSVSGIDLEREWRTEDVARLFALVRAELEVPGWTLNNIGMWIRNTVIGAERVADGARKLEKLVERIGGLVAEAGAVGTTPEPRQEGATPGGLPADASDDDCALFAESQAQVEQTEHAA